MAYIEVELENLQKSAQHLADEIAQREAFLATMETGSQGMAAHQIELDARKANLADINARLPKMEKIISEMKASAAEREKKEKDILATRAKSQPKSEPQPAAT